MPTLWFDLMDAYYPDPDWSDLPGADKSDCLNPDEDDFGDLDLTDISLEDIKTAKDEIREDHNRFDRTIGKSRKYTKPKKITWLKPPTESNA